MCVCALWGWTLCFRAELQSCVKSRPLRLWGASAKKHCWKQQKENIVRNFDCSRLNILQSKCKAEERKRVRKQERERGEEEERAGERGGGAGTAKPVQQLIPIAYQQLANFALTDTLAQTSRETHTRRHIHKTHTHTQAHTYTHTPTLIHFIWQSAMSECEYNVNISTNIWTTFWTCYGYIWLADALADDEARPGPVCFCCCCWLWLTSLSCNAMRCCAHLRGDCITVKRVDRGSSQARLKKGGSALRNCPPTADTCVWRVVAAEQSQSSSSSSLLLPAYRNAPIFFILHIFSTHFALFLHFLPLPVLLLLLLLLQQLLCLCL